MAKKMKKLLALMLALSVTMSLLSMTAFAEEAENPITALETALAEAREILTDREEQLAETLRVYDAAVEAALTENGVLAQVAAAVTEAQEIVDTAQEAVSEAEAAVEDAQAALDALEEGADRTEAEAALNSANEALTLAGENLTIAQRALDTAEADLETAKKSLPEYEALTAAQADVDTARETVDAAQKALDDANKELAQPVMAAINAIEASGFENNYKNKTDEQKQAVADARTAYDALSDAAKAQVSNYGALTTAEKFVNAYSIPTTSKWDVDQQISEWVSTSGWIDQTRTFINQNKGARFDFTIVNTYHDEADGELIQGDQAINVPLAWTWTQGKQTPGAATMAAMTITNSSDHYFTYKSGSLYFGLDDLESYGVMDGTTGFTGDPIAYGSGIHAFKRCSNRALKALYQTTDDLKKEEIQDAALYEKLEEAGYTGEGALARYYLDFYNHYYKTEHTSLDEFTTPQQAAMFSSFRQSNVGETDPEVLQCMYNFFYNELFRAGLTEFDAASIPASGDTYGVGQYMDRDGTPYRTLENELKEAIGMLAPGETVTLPAVYLGLMGEEMTNVNATASFSYQFYFRLAQADSKVTVNKTDASNNVLSGAQFKLYQNVADGTQTTKTYYSLDENNSVVWTADAAAAKVFDAGTFTLELPFGTYYLTEITAPSGYYPLSSDMELVVDETVETINVVNTTSGGGGGTTTPTPDPDPGTDIPEPDVPTGELPDTPVEPEQPVDIDDPDVPLGEAPKTGDLLGLWLVLAGISGMGLAGMHLIGRRKEQEN